MIHYENCPICNSHTYLWKTKKFESQIYKIRRCKKCSYAFVNPRPDEEFIEDFYSNYDISSENITDQDLISYCRVDAKRIVNSIKNIASQGSEILFLDVGSGHGLIAYEAKKLDYNIVALELSKIERDRMYDYTKIHALNSSFENFECNSNKFDVINLSQILEHVVDVNLWIKKANHCMNKNGILSISLPNFNSIFRLFLGVRDPYICPPIHLNFFTEKSLLALLKKNGFEPVKCDYISRIPKQSFTNILPKSIKILDKPLWFLLLLVFKITNVLKIGIMINVYAKKI